MVPPVVPAPKPKPVLLCVVPKLKGLTLAKARLKVKRAHCTLAVKGVHLAAVKLGRISSQSPRPGARVKRGSRLHVVISLGARKAKRHGANRTQ